MNFRLASPTSLSNINRIAALDSVREDGGQLRIGALARHARFETPVASGALGAFLPRVARHIGHLLIRCRGTSRGGPPLCQPCGAQKYLNERHRNDRQVAAKAPYASSTKTSRPPAQGYDMSIHAGLTYSGFSFSVLPRSEGRIGCLLISLMPPRTPTQLGGRIIRRAISS